MHNFICTQTSYINFKAVRTKLQEKSSGQNCVQAQMDGQKDRQPWRFQYIPLYFGPTFKSFGHKMWPLVYSKAFFLIIDIKKYIYYQIIWNNFKSLPHNNILAWCIFKARVDPDIFLRGGRRGMGVGGGGWGGVCVCFTKNRLRVLLYDTLVSGFQWILAVYKKSQYFNNEAVSTFRTFTFNSF